MGTATVNGIDIRFEDGGGDGPPVLFSHGFLMDHTMFDAQVAALGDDYRCIRWDERGFGDTRAPGPFSYWDSAADAISLLDHLEVDQAVLVGMSQGGFLSLRAALLAPERVRGMVLIDSTADVDDAETIAGYRQLLDGVEHGGDEDRAAIFGLIAGLIIGDEQLAADWISKWQAMVRSDLTGLRVTADALLERDDISDRLGEITCPTLIVHGTEDQAIGMNRAEAMCAGLVDCRGIERVDGAAHAANLTHPDVVNPVLRRFLDDLHA